jgi:hypothetical protein
MFTKYNSLYTSAIAVILLTSCQQSGPGHENSEQKDSVATTQMGPITLTDVPASPEFADAALIIGDIKATPKGDSTSLTFKFIVRNYELKNQTPDAASKKCNNSDKGQHIHFIMDNKPYVALYEPTHDVTLAKNTEHYLMTFLSRSYHESLKNDGAGLVYHFKIDDKGKLVRLDKPKTPMIFYSRPKGDYLGKDTENVLLDFYVQNAALGNYYKVKATITAGGKDTSILLSEWKAKFLHNLPMGKATVKLTLVDKDGNKVEGPETEVSRDITLAKEEPLKP